MTQQNTIHTRQAVIGSWHAILSLTFRKLPRRVLNVWYVLLLNQGEASYVPLQSYKGSSACNWLAGFQNMVALWDCWMLSYNSVRVINATDSCEIIIRDYIIYSADNEEKCHRIILQTTLYVNHNSYIHPSLVICISGKCFVVFWDGESRNW